MTDKFIEFKSYINFIKYLPKIIYLHLLNFRKYKNINEIFLLEINGVYVGDAIYDECLRFNKEGTIKTFGWKLFLKITEAYYYYNYLNDLCKTYNYEYIIVNHHCYIKQSLMARIGILAGIKVIYSDGSMIKKLYSMNDAINEYIYQPNNNIINKIFSDKSYIDKLSKNKTTDLLILLGMNFYNNNDDTIDNDFINMLTKLKQSKEKKLVVIYAHGYTDNVVGTNGKNSVFKDTYLWTKNTLELCAKNKNIITVIKWHPAEQMYKAKISTKKIFNEVQKKLNNESLILSPNSIDFKKYPNIVDLVITVRGTIGVEMPCLGVPVLAASKNNAIFSKNNIVIEADNYETYANHISKAHLIPKLTQGEINKAIVFAKLSNILVFDESYTLSFSRSEIVKDTSIIQNATDGKNKPEDIYKENMDDIVNNKLISFNELNKVNFYNKLRLFLDDINMKYLEEVDYEKKLQKLIDIDFKI